VVKKSGGLPLLVRTGMGLVKVVSCGRDNSLVGQGKVLLSMALRFNSAICPVHTCCMVGSTVCDYKTCACTPALHCQGHCFNGDVSHNLDVMALSHDIIP